MDGCKLLSRSRRTQQNVSTLTWDTITGADKAGLLGKQAKRVKILSSWHVWQIHSANTREFTSFMVSSGLSCSTMAWSCRRRASEAASLSFAGEVGEEAVSSSALSLLPSSNRWTAPFTRAKLSLSGGGAKTQGFRSTHRAHNRLRCSFVMVKTEHWSDSTSSEVSLFFGRFHPAKKQQLKTLESRRQDS